MAILLKNLPVTYYADEAKAKEIAAVCQADDAEAEYRAEPYATGFCIAVYVDGELMVRL